MIMAMAAIQTGCLAENPLLNCPQDQPFRLTYAIRSTKPGDAECFVSLHNGGNRGASGYRVDPATVEIVVLKGLRTDRQIRSLVSSQSIPIINPRGSITGVFASTFFSMRLRVGTHRIRLAYSDKYVNQEAKDRKWKWKSQIGRVVGPPMTVEVLDTGIVRFTLDN